MIRPLETFPNQVVAFLCSGEVTKSEYDRVVLPAVRQALETHDKVCLYYETTPDFHLSLGAAWEDFRVGIEHLRRWERLAVVSDVDWIRHAIHAFSFLLPRRLRVFPSSESALARAWIVSDRVH
jgi:hypothetical protein